MKKNLLITLMVCLIVILLSGCSTGAVDSSDLAQSSDGTSSEVNKETDSKEIATEKEISKAEA